MTVVIPEPSFPPSDLLRVPDEGKFSAVERYLKQFMEYRETDLLVECPHLGTELACPCGPLTECPHLREKAVCTCDRSPQRRAQAQRATAYLDAFYNNLRLYFASRDPGLRGFGADSNWEYVRKGFFRNVALHFKAEMRRLDDPSFGWKPSERTCWVYRCGEWLRYQVASLGVPPRESAFAKGLALPPSEGVLRSPGASDSETRSTIVAEISRIADPRIRRILLNELEDRPCTGAALAKELGLSPGRVSQLLARGMEKLRSNRVLQQEFGREAA